jgi:hypothetical protein
MDTVSNLPAQPVSGLEEVQARWGVRLQPAGCAACQQAFLVRPDSLGILCPNCGQSQLENQDALLRPEPPELLVPFEKQRSELLPVLQNFTRGVWLHTPDFTPHSLHSRLAPVYWPMWLVDSGVEGSWQAEVGFDYQVKSSQESYTGAGWQTQSTTETRIRWEPRTGTIARRYQNIAVPAASDHERIIRRTGAYNYSRAGAYQPRQLEGAALRLPDQNPASAWPAAREQVNAAASNECASAAGGQHIRSFSISAGYPGQNWTLLLLPQYVTYYHDDEGKVRMVYINGQTGQAGGVRLASVKQGRQAAWIMAGVAGLILILGLLGLALALLFPPAAVFGGLLLALGLIVGLAAIIPAVWPGHFNSRKE